MRDVRGERGSASATPPSALSRQREREKQFVQRKQEQGAPVALAGNKTHGGKKRLWRKCEVGKGGKRRQSWRCTELEKGDRPSWGVRAGFVFNPVR